jgi:hypothetical protein
LERPEGGQADLRRKPSFYGGSGGLRDQDLPAVGSGRDPSDLMERKCNVIAINRCRLSSVHSHPYLNFGSGRPAVGRQCLLTFKTCGDCLGRIREGDEQ